LEFQQESYYDREWTWYYGWSWQNCTYELMDNVKIYNSIIFYGNTIYNLFIFVQNKCSVGRYGLLPYNFIAIHPIILHVIYNNWNSIWYILLLAHIFVLLVSQALFQEWCYCFLNIVEWGYTWKPQGSLLEKQDNHCIVDIRKTG
jgi:hypothetical protein